MHTYVNSFAGVLLAVRDIAVPGVQGWTRHCQQWSLLGAEGDYCVLYRWLLEGWMFTHEYSYDLDRGGGKGKSDR
jgi:hypothetical protein